MDNIFSGKNLEKLLGQARHMQEEMENTKKMLSQLRVTGAAGGGIQITMNGDRKVLKVDIDKDNMHDRDMLQDLLAIAVNDALDKVETAINEKVQSSLAGSLSKIL